jgi:hypothetical protein
LPVADIHSKNGVVLQAFIGPGKFGEKELTIGLIKSSNDAKKKPVAAEDANYEARLDYQQAAYNAMAACLLCTQSPSKVWQKL